MNIAIFGDSFADSSINRDKFTSQTTYLSNDYNIKNFAKAGTSLWWSYEKFIKNYEKFDTIIFVATGYGRIVTNKFMISGVLQAEFLLKEATAKKDELEKRIYQSAITPDNNKILAEKVKGIIEGTCKKITINDFKFEKFEDSSMYWFSNEESLKSFGKGT